MSQAFRFGLGDPSGLRSSSWKVWSGTDSSVYVASRDIGHALKVSLHPVDPQKPGGEWRIAFEGDFFESHPVKTPDGTRVLEAWDSEDNRLRGTPLKEAFAVVLGRFSLGLHVLPDDPAALAAHRRRLAGVKWIRELPGLDEVWQFTVFIGDPGEPVGPIGTRVMKAIPVGELKLPNDSDVWIMRNLVPMDEAAKQNIALGVQTIANTFGRSDSPSVYRGHLRGKEESGLRWVIEIAATTGVATSLLEVAV